jgi:dolichyl-phosphate beta-glucosyltransferase
MDRTTLIIPCYNEERRLDLGALTSLIGDDIDILFVDDGSKDATRAILNELAREHPDHLRVLGLDQNGGKAEAVRRGLLAAIGANRSSYVGYLDADLATPPHEMKRLITIMRGSTAQVLFGARVALLGHEIERSTVRHYLGRVFGTLASIALRLTIYDTQCGAKLFRVTPTLASVLREPFLSRWVFDVELLGRLLAGADSAPAIPVASVWEEPLRAWRDVKGSKLDARQMARALIDLARIDRDLARRRERKATYDKARAGAAVAIGHDGASTEPARARITNG